MLAGTSALDPNDPFSANLLHGSEQFTSGSYYPWGGDMHQGMKCMPVHPSAYAGMSATLAPAALTTPADSLSVTSATTVDGNNSLAGIDPLGLNHLTLPGKGDHSPHSMPSGQVTPGESFWTNFVQDGGWNDESTASS